MTLDKFQIISIIVITLFLVSIVYVVFFVVLEKQNDAIREVCCEQLNGTIAFDGKDVFCLSNGKRLSEFPDCKITLINSDTGVFK